MSLVIPGQYLVPEYKYGEGDASKTLLHHFPGKGVTASQIKSGEQSVKILVATVLGEQVVQELGSPTDAEKDPEAADAQTKNGKESDKPQEKQFLVSVVPGKKSQYQSYAEKIDVSASASVNATSTNLPRENDTVLVRITRLNLKQAFCEILSVYGHGNVASDGGLGSTGTTAHLSLPMGGGSQILSSYGAVAASQSALAGAQPIDIGESFKGIIRTQDVRSTDRDKVKIIDCFRPGDLVRALVSSLGDGSNYYLTTARNDLGVVYAKSEGGAGDAMIALDWETMVCEKTGVMEKRKCAKLFE